MKQETTGSPRKGLLIAAAATALTVATGVTAGALFGWVGPSRQPMGDAVPTLRAPSAIASENAATPAPDRASAADPTALAELSRDASEPAQDPVAEEPAAPERGEREDHERRERGDHERREHERGEHERREHERGERGEREGDDDD